MILPNEIITPESETPDLEISVANLQSEIFEICNLKSEIPAPADASVPPRLRGEQSLSDRRLAANRANALKSTGPRTPAGKARSRLNALKHGVCSDSPVLPSECAATFATFRHELECNLRPRNPIQLTLFQRIVNLTWKLRRIQEAENHLFEIEAAKVPAGEDGAPPDPCRILAHRFSDDPHNAFILLNRYEQSMHRELRQLITRFFYVQKQVPTTPYSDEDLLPIEPTDPPAPSPQPPAAPDLADSTPSPAHSPLRNQPIVADGNASATAPVQSAPGPRASVSRERNTSMKFAKLVMSAIVLGSMVHAGLLAKEGAASPARGAFEPWASNTDPTDVPKSHVQEITAAPFTYNITQGGTMDGTMCRTLPGVWEPYEQTWESNRSIRMENIGPRNVNNPWLKIGPIDFFSQQTIADSVTAGLSTDREKALAIFYFYITHRYHKGNGDNGSQGDVSQAINVFGYNTCGNSTLCVSDLLSKAGMGNFIFSHCPGHCVPQAFFDGRYNTLDGDMATMMLLRDNHTLANERDLIRDHDLIKRVHQYGIMSPMNPVRNNEDYSQYYTFEGDTTQKLKGWNWWAMGMVLRPHEAIEWRWGHETPVKYHGDMSGNPPMAPDTIYNGLWEYAPDFKNDAQSRAGAAATNIASKDGVLTAADGGTGTIVWQMRVPYQFIGGALTLAGEGYAFEIGLPNPKDGKPVYAALATLAEFDGKFQRRTAMATEYWLKCTLTGKASLSGLKITNDIQLAPLAMPSMTVGNNSLTYLEHPDNRTGTNAARHLKITHNWVERSRTRPPQAPQSPVYPPSGGKSDGTDVVFQWQAATDPDGDAIADYRFQLSDRPDMRWPLSPNFDKYVSKTPDKGATSYTLPRPGLLTNGTTYYWRVKAKDSNGVWGPWSETWSFTAQGPAYPISLAIKHSEDTGIGTLTWSANPVGTAPARYRIYGSDEKGFTVHDAPYEVKLGDTKELANPFPANFVAEVASTSLDVLGVGNTLPNANKAYYRVVAVDGAGKRSGDSDYVESPRPVIYSSPITSAPAGQAYRYQVQAIRSIGDFTRRDGARPKPGAKFWKIEPLKFSLTQKPAWMSIDPSTGLITGTSDGTGGTVVVSVTLTKERRLVHDANAIVWGNEYEQSKTYETVGPATQQFVVHGAKDK